MGETIINGQYYIEAGGFVSESPSVYTLKAIQIEPHPAGGAVIIACDGHTLGVFRDESAICTEPVLINYRREVLPFLRPPRARKNRVQGIRCIRINGEVEIVEAEYKNRKYEPGKALVRFLDLLEVNGSFPDWKKVLPKEPPPLRSDFNGDYLRRCALDKRSKGVTIWHSEKGDTPAVVRSMSRDDFVAVVMPMRGQDHPAYPAYVQPFLAPAPVVEPAAEKVRLPPLLSRLKRFKQGILEKELAWDTSLVCSKISFPNMLYLSQFLQTLVGDRAIESSVEPLLCRGAFWTCRYLIPA